MKYTILTFLFIMSVLLAGCLPGKTPNTVPDIPDIYKPCEQILSASDFVGPSSTWSIIQTDYLGDGFYSIWKMIPPDSEFAIQKAMVVVVTHTLAVRLFYYICDGECYGFVHNPVTEEDIKLELSTDMKEIIWDYLYI